MGRSIQLPTRTCPQGSTSLTFRSPPLDTFLSLPEVCDWHATHSAQHPFYIYHDDDTDSNGTVTWGETVQAIYKVAHSVSASIVDKEASRTHARPVVGLYTSCEALTYIIALFGIMRAGFTVFLISHRISPTTLEHLIVTSGLTHIVLSQDDEQLASKVRNAQKNVNIPFTVSFIPAFSQLFSGESVQAPSLETPDLDDNDIVLHSSGSTALPELNFYTNRLSHTALWVPWYGEQDICGHVLSIPSIPMSGAAGVLQALFAASSGIILSGFKPSSNPVLANPDNVWASMRATQSTYCVIFQPFLAKWSQDMSKVAILAGMEGVMYGGGPLPKPVGDALAAKGVNIFTLFGSSEAGIINKVFPKKSGLDWEWFSFYPLLHPAFRPADDGLFELILKTGETHQPTKTNEVFDGVPALATGDLLRRHPTIPDLWKFVCRISDQETVGHGVTKINAVALGRMLMQEPLINGAVLFNQIIGSTSVFGVILEPARSFTVQSSIVDSDAVQTYLDRIRPTLERYNSIVPEPAKLTKEKIILAAPDKPFLYSDKGMPRRKDAILVYQGEITRLARD